MSVVTVPVSMNVPKESKEVLDAAFGIVEHFKNGGDLAGAAALLPAVLSAVEGVDKIGEELKNEHVGELAAYAVSKVVKVLQPKLVPVV